jgi:ectoine hydroxylase-related dioxygenase (phytanoyl-CoA dioxygenase family)
MIFMPDPIPGAMLDDLSRPYELTPDQIETFRRDGFIKLPNVLSQRVLDHFGPLITRAVYDLNTMHLPMEQRTTYQKAFLQITNLWTREESCRPLVFSRRLARIATELMGVVGVRMWHDQALYKEPGGGFTPWHADQYYWPISNANIVTAWIPLQRTPREMGPLAFAVGSQHCIEARHLAISDESEAKIAEMVARRYRVEDSGFEAGEVSFHYGWTYHRAGPNTTTTPRAVMTVIYMDMYAHVAPPANPHQQVDLEAWLPGRRPGDLADTHLNPVMYESSGAG